MFLYLVSVKQSRPLFKKINKKGMDMSESSYFSRLPWLPFFLVLCELVYSPNGTSLNICFLLLRFFLVYLWPFHSENAVHGYSHLTILNSISFITHKISPGQANRKNMCLAVLPSGWIPADSTRLRHLRKWWKHTCMKLFICFLIFLTWKFHFNLFLLTCE